jgi:hypothetical protein
MKLSAELEKYRVLSGVYSSRPGEQEGVFVVPGPCGRDLLVGAVLGDAECPWDHVSVSLRNRYPNWPEMCFIKSRFWDDEETVIQFHPLQSTWFKNFPFRLHWWRPLAAEIPLPPTETEGFKELNPGERSA